MPRGNDPDVAEAESMQAEYGGVVNAEELIKAQSAAVPEGLAAAQLKAVDEAATAELDPESLEVEEGETVVAHAVRGSGKDAKVVAVIEAANGQQVKRLYDLEGAEVDEQPEEELPAVVAAEEAEAEAEKQKAEAEAAEEAAEVAAESAEEAKASVAAQKAAAKGEAGNGGDEEAPEAPEASDWASMTVAELDAAGAGIEGYPADANKAEKVAFMEANS